MINCSANLFSAILNKLLWCHVTSEKNFFNKYKLSRIFQGSKFAVATVANATMFCHLLPGCSSGSKHLLLP